MRILVLRAELGEIKEKNIVEGEFNNVLKDVVMKALNIWEPQKSDLIVMKHKHEINIKLPIKKEQYDLYSQLNLRRKGDVATVEVIVYLVSFENQWIDDNIIDSKVFIVAPYIDEFISEKVEELAKGITSPEHREEEETEEE
ncbi:MAG: DUF2286 domain-containing protein [Ignisphaera sp.]